jgi:hypothetical protein
MSNVYNERNARLKSLSSVKPASIDDMCLSFNLTDRLINELRLSTKMFFHECLSEYFQKEYDEFKDIDDFVKKYEEDIKVLPNITPNGLVLSKQETSCSYNKILKVAANIVDYLGLSSSTMSIHFPVNVRLRWGSPDDYTLSRPYASTKWHSDIWAGESSENIILHIPIFGDFKNNGISIAESQDGFYPKYVTHLRDYEDASELTKDIKHRDMDMEIGKAYMLDSFLIHKTKFGDPSFRAILSFPFVPKQKLESDIYHNSIRDENYLDVETWMNVGKKYFVVTDSKLEKYRNQDVTKISYADKYRLSR